MKYNPRIFFVFFPLLILMIFSCDRIREKPNDLIEKGKMADILVDYYLYQQSVNVQSLQLKMKDFPELNHKILKKHQVDYVQFNQSLEYYVLQERKTYAKILDDVEGKLNALMPIYVNPKEEVNPIENVMKTRPKPKERKKKKLYKDSVIITDEILKKKAKENQSIVDSSEFFKKPKKKPQSLLAPRDSLVKKKQIQLNAKKRQIQLKE